MLTMYGKKEQDGSVSIFEDAEGTKKYATFPDWHSGKPDYRFKYITLNCWKWRIVWIK